MELTFKLVLSLQAFASALGPQVFVARLRGLQTLPSLIAAAD
jgi:hypothetical protein